MSWIGSQVSRNVIFYNNSPVTCIINSDNKQIPKFFKFFGLKIAQISGCFPRKSCKQLEKGKRNHTNVYMILKIQNMEVSKQKTSIMACLPFKRYLQLKKCINLRIQGAAWHQKVSLKGSHSLNSGLNQKSFVCISFPQAPLKKNYKKHFYIRT